MHPDASFPVAGPARPVRAFPTPPATEPVVIAPPPARPEPEGARWLTTLLPALSSFGIVGFALVSGSLLYVVLGVALTVVGVGAALGARVAGNRTRRRRHEGLRRRYGEHLDERHALLSGLAREQRHTLELAQPDPLRWRVVLSGDRLWERRPSDADFLSLRLGSGRLASTVPIRLEPSTPSTEEEADLREEAELLVALHAVVDDAPVAVDLRTRRSLVVEGPAVHGWPLLRAVVLGLALTRAPGDLVIVAVADDDEAAWLCRLPHTAVVVPEVAAAARAVRTVDAPAVVLLVDARVGAAELAVLSRLTHDHPGLRLLLRAPADVPPPLEVDAHGQFDADGGLLLRFADGSPTRFIARPDALSPGDAEEAAAGLARVPLVTVERARAEPVRLAPLLDEHLDRCPPLTVPLGRDVSGDPVRLDLAEAALGGDGPHGLLIGATGSGKSQLLRTMLAALVTRRGPSEVAVVCWDFKGGAAVAPFAGLAHLRGIVTNLESDDRLLARAARSLRAELRRRQRILDDAGVDAVHALPPVDGSPALPTLVLVVDEFSELLAASPELIDLFVSVARLGRSLGVHLLLSSQRLDEGRLRGLESHLRYRICLRTFSAADSQAVLGSDAAHRLPSTPGSGLLAVDGTVRRFDGALADDLPELLTAASARHVHPVPADAGLWQPALPSVLALDHPVPSSSPPPDGRELAAAIGLVDLPDEQTRAPLIVDLERAHAVLVGAPGSGRTTSLATLLTAMTVANRATALEAHVVTDDPASFAVLADLPQVRSVLRPDDEEQLRHLLTGLVREVRRRAGDPSATGRHVLVLIDGWPRVRQAGDDLGDAVVELAATGLRHGVHLVLAGTGWSEFRTGLREHLGTRLELWLPDPYESEHGRQLAALLPRRPGRLLRADGAEAQVALPRADGVPDVEGMAEAQRSLVDALLARGDVPLPRFRPLPGVVPLHDLAPQGDALALGVDADGRTESVDLSGRDRTLLVIGEAGSGRTTALRALLVQLAAQRVVLQVIDPRRTLLDSVPPRAEYAYTPGGAATLLTRLATELEQYRPAEGLSRDELLGRVGLLGPERPTVLLVDDYDLLSTAGLSGPLGPLADLVPFAGELGLSVVLARGTSPRLGFDAGWQALVDRGVSGVLLSGDPTDAPLLAGLRARHRPPGRGTLVRSGRAAGLVQVAWTEPDLRARPERREEAPAPRQLRSA